MIFSLICLLVIIAVLFYIILYKVNYELHGFEIILYQISFLFLFHVGKYCRINFYQEYAFIYLLLLLFGYYVINFIKNKRYICLDVLSAYFVIMIVNKFSLTFFNKVSIFNLSTSNVFFAYNSLFLFLILMFNLFLFILSKRKKMKLEKKLVLLKNKFSIFMIFLVAISGIFYKYVGVYFNHEKALNKATEYLSNINGDQEFNLLKDDENQMTYFYNLVYQSEETKEYFLIKVDKETFYVDSEKKMCLIEEECLEIADKNVHEYLKKQYGEFDYEKVGVSTDSFNFYVYSFSSEYTIGGFDVYISKETLDVVEENFSVKYYGKLFGQEFESLFELNKYLEKEVKEFIEKEMMELFDVEISNLVVSCDISQETGSLLSSVDIDEIMGACKSNVMADFLIKRKFKSSDKEKFVKYILKIYVYYTSHFGAEQDNMYFDFAYENPFYNSPNEFYKYGGYIKDAGAYYYLYLQPTPDKIKK